MKRYLNIACLLLIFYFENSALAVSFRDKVCFKSAESSHDLGIVRNCIVLLEQKDSQFWLMKQDIDYAKGKVANLIGIEVQIPNDSKRSKPIAKYFEYDRNEFERSGKLIQQPFKVPCIMCHPSGPRAIRPDFDDAAVVDVKKIKIWNQKIADLKYVENAKASSSMGKLELTDEKSKIPLNLTACNGCHGANGVRSPLSYMQGNSIAFLTLIHKSMPMQGYAFNEMDRICLDKWLEQPYSEECGSKVKMPKNEKNNSYLTVKIETTFHDFEMEPLPVRVKKTCTNVNCQVIATVPLARLESGIEARNQTIHHTLQTDQFSDAKISATLPREKFFNGEVEGVVMIKDRSQNQKVKLSCDELLSACTLNSTEIDLRKWGLQMPNIFGIKVNRVMVSGSFQD